jgi:hypothetical protein
MIAQYELTGILQWLVGLAVIILVFYYLIPLFKEEINLPARIVGFFYFVAMISPALLLANLSQGSEKELSALAAFFFSLTTVILVISILVYTPPRNS